MNSKNRTTLLLVLNLCFALALFYMLFTARGKNPAPPATATPTSLSEWDTFVAESLPVAYHTPLPNPVAAPFDGVYAKLIEAPPQWWGCLRCADYRPSGGIWMLQFERGVMRIFYEVTGWRSVASYTFSSDGRLSIFNDPYCPDDVGEYRWDESNGELKLELVNDACAFDLRAESLTGQTWRTCSASSLTGEGAAPWPGCSRPPSPESDAPPSGLTVRVLEGDARFFDRPPDVIAHANRDDVAPPQGIEIDFHADSVGYGLQRVVWWNGSWIEATTETPFTAIGVQFMGKKQIGWARVLFDGVEVWRGNTSAIWSRYDRHGGYVEISGFAPGLHTIRVEALGFDFRPVTVASFGFSYGEGVEDETP